MFFDFADKIQIQNMGKYIDHHMERKGYFIALMLFTAFSLRRYLRHYYDHLEIFDRKPFSFKYNDNISTIS